MWVFLNDAFVSIVEDENDADWLLCRARLPGDLQRAFGGYLRGRRVKHTPNADYAYRVSLPRETVARALVMRLRGLHYLNFKNSVSDDHRHSAYTRVWAVMRAEQERGQRPSWPDLFGDRQPEVEDDGQPLSERIVRCPLHGEVSAGFCIGVGCPHAGTAEWRKQLLPMP